MRFLRSLLFVFLLCCLLFSGVLLAYTGEPYDPKNARTWNQYQCEGAGLNLGLYDNGYYLGSHGCAIHSLTAAYVRYGAREPGYVPMDFREEGIIMGGSGGIDLGGGLNWAGAGNMSNGALRMVWPDVHNGHMAKHHFVNDPSYLQGLLDDGYCIILQQLVPGAYEHYIMLDSITSDGRIRVVDSGFPITYLDESPCTTAGMVLYEVLSGVDRGSYYGNAGRYVGGDSDGDASGGRVILSEAELLGMPVTSLDMGDHQDVGIITSFDLMQDAYSRMEIEQLGEDLGIGYRGAVNYGVVMSVVGMVIVFWSMLRIVAWFIDLNLGSELFAFINLGRIFGKDVARVNGGKWQWSSWGVWVSSLLMAFVGILMLSGVLLRLIVRVMG